MRSPSLKDLPPPPKGKKGWPWTEESMPVPDRMPDGKEWPKISIITPSYNQGDFIEETIRSVLLQGYPNLEYIIIDGGSRDQSVEIIKKYEPWLTYWVSEPDKGQADAINKGLLVSSGNIISWLNSDDVYIKGVFKRIAISFSNNTDIIYGDSQYVNEETYCLDYIKSDPYISLKSLIFRLSMLPQPSVFISARLFETLDSELHFSFDYDLWLKIFSRSNVIYKYIPSCLSYYRLHANSKTVTLCDNMIKEDKIILQKNEKLLRNKLGNDIFNIALSYTLVKYILLLYRTNDIGLFSAINELKNIYPNIIHYILNSKYLIMDIIYIMTSIHKGHDLSQNEISHIKSLCTKLFINEFGLSTRIFNQIMAQIYLYQFKYQHPKNLLYIAKALRMDIIHCIHLLYTEIKYKNRKDFFFKEIIEQ